MGWIGFDLLEVTEIAWAAGFFDGEGTIFMRHEKAGSRHKNRPNYPCTSVALSVTQVEREPLDRFQRVVGGRRVGGPYTPRHPNARPYHRWDACGRPSVYRVLTLLWPYLSEPKRRQAHRVWSQLAERRTVKSPILRPLPPLAA